MLVKQILLVIIGFSGGAAIAGGVFSLIVSLGVISDFADRTKTADKLLLYENCVMLGAILGNIFYIYQIHIPYGGFLLPIFGLFSGMFVGAYLMALAEILNIFPIFIRRVKLIKFIPYLILGVALGKGFGLLIHFYFGW